MQTELTPNDQNSERIRPRTITISCILIVIVAGYLWFNLIVNFLAGRFPSNQFHYISMLIFPVFGFISAWSLWFGKPWSLRLAYFSLIYLIFKFTWRIYRVYKVDNSIDPAQYNEYLKTYISYMPPIILAILISIATLVLLSKKESVHFLKIPIEPRISKLLKSSILPFLLVFLFG
jgi:hypothetical protein